MMPTNQNRFAAVVRCVGQKLNHKDGVVFVANTRIDFEVDRLRKRSDSIN
jgi:hypothetical protein